MSAEATQSTDATEAIVEQHAAKLRTITGVESVSVENGREPGELKLVVTPTDTLGKYTVEDHVHENEYGVFIEITEPNQ